MQKVSGTVPVFVTADIGDYKNYICVFRGSRDIYGEYGSSKIEPLGITGIFLADDRKLRFPKFEVAELIRKTIIVTVSISYSDGSDYPKNRRIYLADKHANEFVKSVRAGSVKIGNQIITSVHFPTKQRKT
jgi:hypothetical protein